ncbi:MAG: MauE/DoxX family redox-associated membrane protein [Solirubrobacteraceae bacterium]
MLRALLLPPLLTVAAVLVVAGVAKLRAPGRAVGALQEAGLPGGRTVIRLVAVAELAVGLMNLLAPSRGSAAALALAYLAFAVFTARLIRIGRAGSSCGCFGEGAAPAHAGHVALNLMAAGLGSLAVLSPPDGLVAILRRDPALGSLTLLTVAGAAWALCLIYAALPNLVSPAGATPQPAVRSPLERIVTASGSLLERRLSRRSLITRATLGGSAFAIAPLHYLLRPDPAWAVIAPRDCSRKSACNDGYTAFCCEINHGRNACPTNTYVAGWWKCTDYRGRGLCSGEGIRYYVDCNRTPGKRFAGGCRCAGDDCSKRRVDCNHFRYGQCNTQVHGTTEVVCRLVVCKHPAAISDFQCNHTYKVDDTTCRQEAGCLEPLVAQYPGGGA